ncbi:hypothetical protein Tco_0451331 [Tanacetum coccineum]
MTHPHPNRRFVPQEVLTRSGKINTAGASVNTAGASVNNAGARINTVNTVRVKDTTASSNPQQKEYKEKRVIDSGCSRHMTRNKCYLTEYKDGGFVSFGDGQAEKKIEPEQEYILIPICTIDPLISQDPKVSEEDAEKKPTEMDESGALDKDGEDDQATRSTPVSTAGPSYTDDDLSSPVNAVEASNALRTWASER